MVYPFLEYIPDASSHWNPCDNPSLYPNTELQYNLSCMAKHNNIYLVANIGDKQPCQPVENPKCPADGRYQFNTNVVYNPNGDLIAKYHKYNLYFEYQFDTPDKYDVVTFDTPFGTFGTFICFDILFENPAVSMVQTHKIPNIIFTTAWMDATPFLFSVQFHSSFAMTHGVNLLSANLHLPEYRFQGSGIFTPDGAAAYYHNRTVGSDGKLIIATIPVNKHITNLPLTVDPSPMSLSKEETFKSVMFRDTHNLVALKQEFGKASVCHDDLCCNVSYNKNTAPWVQGSDSNYFFALAAYSGLHHNARYYMQICSLVKCTATGIEYICGQMNSTNYEQKIPLNDVKTFSLFGNFSTPYVYPQIFMESGQKLELTSYPRSWTYENGYLMSDEPFQQPLGVASLFGRDYKRDTPIEDTKDQTNNSCIYLQHSVFSTILLAFVLNCV